MTLTWDLFIILFFVIMGVYGFLLGRSRVFSILISSYVALVIATELGSYAFDYLSKITEVSHSFNVTLFGAKVFTFIAVIFVLLVNNDFASGGDSSASPVVTALYGILAAGIVLSAAFEFMALPDRVSLFASSGLATQVYTFRLIWLVAPIGLLVFNAVYSKFRR